jgi:hypothetical protein
MKILKAVWTDIEQAHEITIHSIEEGVRLVEELETRSGTHAPPMVEFSSTESETSLSIGVGRDGTVVTFNESLDPPYYISLGDLTRTGVKTFCWGKQETEYLARNIVSAPEGKTALAHFLTHLNRPPNLRWEKL